MFIRKLDLYNFRNIDNYSLDLKYGSNLIFGNNGAGKTSILEALYLIAFGKSFYNISKKEILQYGKDEFAVIAKSENNDRKKMISCNYNSNKGFKIKLDEKKSSLADVNKQFYPLFFSSSNYIQVIESRTMLRKLFNRLIHGIDLLYLHYVLSYNKTLQQKNSLLRESSRNRAFDSWNLTISEIGSKVVNSRFQIIEMLNEKIKEVTDQKIKTIYKPSVEYKGNKITSKEYYNYLQKNSLKEISAGRSLYGPQLDKYNFTLNGKDLRYYSSGEKKFALLNIFFAYIELFKDINKTYPVFMIDDFDIAIDKNNIDKLVNKYPDMQIIATSVNYYEKFNNLIELKKEN